VNFQRKVFLLFDMGGGFGASEEIVGCVCELSLIAAAEENSIPLCEEKIGLSQENSLCGV
jgi:hypothetical protein